MLIARINVHDPIIYLFFFKIYISPYTVYSMANIYYSNDM